MNPHPGINMSGFSVGGGLPGLVFAIFALFALVYIFVPDEVGEALLVPFLLAEGVSVVLYLRSARQDDESSSEMLAELHKLNEQPGAEPPVPPSAQPAPPAGGAPRH
jgi:hypothetical protein